MEASNIEPTSPDDKMIVVRIKASDWDALTGDGMPLPGPSRLQLVKQPGETAGGLETYGVRLVAP